MILGIVKQLSDVLISSINEHASNFGPTVASLLSTLLVKTDYERRPRPRVRRLERCHLVRQPYCNLLCPSREDWSAHRNAVRQKASCYLHCYRLSLVLMGLLEEEMQQIGFIS